MNDLAIYTGIFVVSVFVSSCSQILLKISANKEHANRRSEYVNPWVIGAYSLFLLSTVVTVIAYRVVPLSLGPVLEALGYVFVAILGILVLRERLNFKAIAGLFLIIVGVVVCSL